MGEGHSLPTGLPRARQRLTTPTVSPPDAFHAPHQPFHRPPVAVEVLQAPRGARLGVGPNRRAPARSLR